MIYRMLLFPACMAVVLMACGCGGAGRDMTLEAEEGTEVRIYEVFGMDCPGCHGGLEKLVNKLPGVLASQANWKKQRLAVRLQQETELKDEDIFEAVRRANFTPGRRLD